MIWISVAVGAVCGLAAGILAMIAAGGIRGNGKKFGVVFGAAFALLFVAARVFVVPHAEARYTISQVDRQLSQNAAFAALKMYDMPTYRSILTELGILARQGKTQNEVFLTVRGIVEPLIIKRIPEASDEAAARYMTVMLQEMKELYAGGGDLCYRYMFPVKGQPLDMSKQISEALRKEDNEALGEVLRSAASSPQSPPLASEVEPLIQAAVAPIAERYGRDLAMLQNPRAPGVDKSRLCEMTINLYGRILRLPPDQSGKVIRHILKDARG